MCKTGVVPGFSITPNAKAAGPALPILGLRLRPIEQANFAGWPHYEELLFTGSAKPLDLWASGRIVTPTPYYAHTGWPMLPRDLFALTNLLDFYTERVLCCCWLADKKDIRPVKNLAPSVPKGCLGDFSWPGLTWSGLHKTGRLIGQTTETVIYSTHNETAVRKHVSSTTNNNKTVLFFFQFWPSKLCRLIVLCILCV